MTQDEKRIAFHKLIDNVFDSGEVFDWIGAVEIGEHGSNKPTCFMIIVNSENSTEKALDLLISGAMEVEKRGFLKDMKNEDLYDWRDGSKMEWGAFKP